MERKNGTLEEMVKKSNFFFIDKPSLVILILLTLILISIIFFFINLGFIGYLVISLYLFSFLKEFNYVIAYNNEFIILKKLVILKKVKNEDVIKLSCERAGIGRSSSTIIFLYYKSNNKQTKSIFLNYRIFGLSTLISFLNKIDKIIEIDDKSFEKINIKKIDDYYCNF